MKFSIIVPVYNVEKYIDECINSVMMQTYKNFELILIDDGSTDRSGIICDYYAQKYGNIFTYHKRNKGQLHTRRYGIDRAQGDYYVFLDADDTLRKNALKTIKDKILTYHCDCVIYEFEKFLNGQSLEKKQDWIVEDRVITDKRELYRMVFLDHRYNSLCRKAVKASVFTGQDYGDFCYISHGEDLLQSLEILENCEKVVVISQPLYNYRMHEASLTHTICIENYHIDFVVEEQMMQLLERAAVFTEEDYRDLRNYRIKLLVDRIRIVASLDATMTQKIQRMVAIKPMPYFRDFLAVGKCDFWRLGTKGFYFWLFCKDQYTTVIILESIYVWFRPIILGIRKIRRSLRLRVGGR